MSMKNGTDALSRVRTGQGGTRSCASAIGRVALVAAAIGVASSFAATAPSFVTDEAVFWLDASTLSQLPGQEVTSWPDVRGAGYPVATSCATVVPKMISTSGARGTITGKKAVTFFAAKTQCDMNFTTDYNVKAAFFVVDIDATQDAFLLGGPNTATQGGHNYAFHRSGANYKYGYAPACTYWNDGVQVENPGDTAIPTDYQLISYRYDATGAGAAVQQLTRDRNQTDRVGGKRLCEVITFSRVLTDDERVAVEDYLRAKWFEESWSWSEGVSVESLLGLAQVRFDASAASSFHYDTEDPTKVVQWDDLSGNGNNFTAGSARLKDNSWVTVYGTVGTVMGQPAFDMGEANSGIDLTLGTRLTDTRTMFMVASVGNNGTSDIFWLGDIQGGNFRFHRGSGGGYFYGLDAVYARPEINGRVWCNGVSVTSSGNTPEKPGALSVYNFVVSKNCEWKNLGQDRDCAGRNGGKKVAELITFDFEMPDGARKRIEDYLIEKWTPTEAYIDSMAAVHVDASSADNFNYTDANITGWKNTALGADLYKETKLWNEAEQYDVNCGSYGFTNGVPAFLMGTVGSNIDLAFERLTNIRAVFWAMDIQRHQQAFFLGDHRPGSSTASDYSQTFNFHRGGSGQYAYDHGSAIWKNYKVVCDGTEVSNMTSDKPPYGMHVFDHVASADLIAASLSKDRWCRNANSLAGQRDGGRAISELLIFTNEVWGLTRVGVRKRIENKWTRKCGWAGAGDAEWSGDKYRVFGADATVPEGGASAKGVGFTADATLDGDALALGAGGFFANEDVTASIEASVTGDVGVFGAGTVLFASAQTLQSLYVGCNATAELKPGSTITGNVTMLKDSKIVVDVSGLSSKEYAEISIGGTVTLPEGGTFLDYLALSDDSHVISLSDDGKKILVNDNVPVRAVWKGGADATDAANWTCYDDEGDVIANKLPGMYVTNITLAADCNLGGWTTAPCRSGAVIDLAGHTLEVKDLSDSVYPEAVITNSADATTATLDVTVASGATASDSTAVICGNVKFVKSGKGTFVGNVGQLYTGGTEVREGMLKAGIAGTLKPFGVPVSEADLANIEVAPGAIFDFAQKCGWGGYRMTLAGGVLQNSNGGFDDAAGGTFTNIVITADGSRFDSPGRPTPWGVFGNGTSTSGYPPTSIDLGSHDLTINVSWFFKLCNTTILGDGNITVKGSDAFQTGYNGRAHANGEIAATNVDFRIETPLRIYAPFSLHDYEAAHANLNTVGGESTAEMKVFGTFTPASHDAFYGCTMMDGSTIDLKNRTEEGKVPFNLTCAMTGDSANCQHKSVTFTPGANVTVDLSAFTANLKTLANGYVLTWDTPPASSVKFVPDEYTMKRGYAFAKDDSGLRLISCGFTIFVR